MDNDLCCKAQQALAMDMRAVVSALLCRKDCLNDQNFPRTVGLTFVAYHPDRVFCEQTNKDTDRLVFYGEPTPESIGA